MNINSCHDNRDRSRHFNSVPYARELMGMPLPLEASKQLSIYPHANTASIFTPVQCADRRAKTPSLPPSLTFFTIPVCALLKAT